MRQLEGFLPPPFPITLTYTESGDGVRPPVEAVPVGAKPGAYSEEQHYSRARIEDTRIRSSIEQALFADEQEVNAMTKFLVEAGQCGTVQELYAVQLDYPNTMPSPGKGGGNNNTILRRFAFDAYDVLAERFGEKRFFDWYILPYFQEGDDMRSTMRLGVFIAHHFEETVVE